MKLQEVCEVYSGYALKEFHDDEEGYPVIKIGNICSDGTLDLEKCQFTNDSVNEKYFSKKGDIYVALSGATTGKIGIITTDDKYIINQRVGIVRNNDEEIPDQYIKYFLMNKTEKILEDASGCAQPNISPKQIGQYEFPKGDYSEMRNISDILDRISNVIMQRKQELQKLEELIKARFVELFGDPLINSKGLDTMPMTEVCEIIDGDRGKNYPTADEFLNEGYCLFLNAKNVTASGFSFDSCMFVSKEKDETLRKGKLSRGDVVLTTRGTLGNLAFYTDEIPYEHVRINSGMVILRMNKEILDEIYFIEQFKLQLADIKEKIASGSAQPQLPISTMNKIQILIPGIELQKQYADFVKQVDKSKIVWLKAPNIINYTHEKLAPYMYKTYRRNAKWQILNF